MASTDEVGCTVVPIGDDASFDAGTDGGPQDVPAVTIDPDGLSRQMHEPCGSGIVDAYEMLARAVLPRGMHLRRGSHVYGAPELQFRFEGRYHYAAVLNQKWILWYVRRPAFEDTRITVSDIQRYFPTAEATAYGEVKVRLMERLPVLAMIGLIHQHYPRERQGDPA